MGEGKNEKKKKIDFFLKPFLPDVLDSVFFRPQRMISSHDTPSWHLSVPGFWKLIKGGTVHQVQFQPNVNEETANRSMRGKVYLAISKMTSGKSRWWWPPSTVRLNISTLSSSFTLPHKIILH